MPAKRDKRAAAKVPKELEENESNAEEQEVEKQPVTKKRRVPKVKAAPERAEKSVAPEKKSGRGRKHKSDEGASKDLDGGEATATVSKRGQASKTTETEKPTDTGTEAQESKRKGAVRTTKKATNVIEEAGEKVQKPVKARVRKAADKGVESEAAEPAVKKSRVRPKTKENKSETKPNRKVRQQKNASKGKDVTEEGDDLPENGGSVQNADRVGGRDLKELRVSVEHCKS